MRNEKTFHAGRIREGRLAPTADTLAQVWAGAEGNELRLLSNNQGETTFRLLEPGFFDGGMGVIPGIPPGNHARVQIRAWRDARSFGSADMRGVSPVFTQHTGALVRPPWPPAPASLLVPGAVVLRVLEQRDWERPLPAEAGLSADVVMKGNPGAKRVQIVRFSRLANGEVLLTIISEPGAAVNLQVSTDMVSWETADVLANVTGVFEWVDPDAVIEGQRFYRVLLTP